MRENEIQIILQALADYQEAAQVERDRTRIELRTETIHNRTLLRAGLDSMEERLERLEQFIRETLARPNAERAR
jgi:hypothetical protein